jgi:DNA repair exonuclease SbcCD ATPase subunit
MQEMDRRMALLRLLLADLSARLREAQEAQDGLRGQLSRIVDFAVRSNVSVANALAALAEVEERAAKHEMTVRHLKMLKQRAESELEALTVTRGVTDAHARLHELETRRRKLLASPPTVVTGPSGAETQAAATLAQAANELAEVEAEIAQLQAEINAASDAAARALTEGPRERR